MGHVCCTIATLQGRRSHACLLFMQALFVLGDMALVTYDLPEAQRILSIVALTAADGQVCLCCTMHVVSVCAEISYNPFFSDVYMTTSPSYTITTYIDSFMKNAWRAPFAKWCGLLGGAKSPHQSTLTHSSLFYIACSHMSM